MPFLCTGDTRRYTQGFMLPSYFMKNTTICLGGPWSKVTQTHKKQNLCLRKEYMLSDQLFQVCDSALSCLELE